ncbi:MAG: hypothetical protein GY742_19560 [Hyphomicrobiales bacterium]|nr:hypothetical protein [Hyphomicrobiales bacterium]
MLEPVTLHGYRFSVYNRVARLVLHQKDVAYDIVEVNPFNDLDPAYLDLHPFGRVPTLVHGAFSVFETRAITSYIEHAFVGLQLQPDNSKAFARMDKSSGSLTTTVTGQWLGKSSPKEFFDRWQASLQMKRKLPLASKPPEKFYMC